MKKLLIILLLISIRNAAQAQPKLDRVKVFVDCSQTWICNLDYVRSEIKMVDFVRDRRDADVHVLVTAQSSNNGGTKARLNFIGLHTFQGTSDTLTYFNDPTSTEDVQRKRLVQYIKLGLVRYIAASSIAEALNITYTLKDSALAHAPKAKDPWNYWVFQATTFGTFSGTEAYKNASINASFSASRETEKWKMNAQLSFNKSTDTYVDTSGKSRFTRKGVDGGFEMVKVLDKHWAVGGEANYSNSLYSNLHAGFKLRPKLEYSLLPYSKFNTERIVFQYLVGPTAFYYYDTTIYYKTQQWEVQQSVNVIGSFTKPWGAINAGIFYSNYMSDFSRNNLNFNGAVSWKIARGLNFAIWGTYGLIHDQIALRKGDISRDDLLVKTRELKSNYSYNLGVAFTYRFGSILNNFINPAFRGLNYSINF